MWRASLFAGAKTPQVGISASPLSPISRSPQAVLPEDRRRPARSPWFFERIDGISGVAAYSNQGPTILLLPVRAKPQSLPGQAGFARALRSPAHARCVLIALAMMGPLVLGDEGQAAMMREGQAAMMRMMRMMMGMMMMTRMMMTIIII